MPDHDATAPASEDRYHIMRMASADVCRQAAMLCARAAWALGVAEATRARLWEVRRAVRARTDAEFAQIVEDVAQTATLLAEAETAGAV